jgi:hypothetical protein
MKLISNSCDKQDNCIGESSMVKVITALNESVGFIFDFLLDAKVYGILKVDLLASICIVGSYLEESTDNKEFQQLLPEILSVIVESEETPFLSL